MTVMLCGLAEIRMEMSLWSAADDTTYNFFPYNECHPVLVFRVFCTVPDLVSLVRGSFSKPCPSDLCMAQDARSIAFQLMDELLYISAGMQTADGPCFCCCSFFWHS